MEDFDRDFVAHIKDRLRLRQAKSLQPKKVPSEHDILGKGLNRFWNDFRKAIGELCERLSRELGVSLSCKWNGEELEVTRSDSRFILNARLEAAPPYEILISGKNGLHCEATVRIVLEDSQLDCLAEMGGDPTSPRKVAAQCLEKLLLG